MPEIRQVKKQGGETGTSIFGGMTDERSARDTQKQSRFPLRIREHHAAQNGPRIGGRLKQVGPIKKGREHGLWPRLEIEPPTL